jgi:hypothetical protein
MTMTDPFEDAASKEELVCWQTPCNCGRGWCPTHGTDHLSTEEERTEVERLIEMAGRRGTCGGRRVIRKKLRGGD